MASGGQPKIMHAALSAALFFAATLLLPEPGTANTYTGADIYSECKQYEDTVEAITLQAFCNGYVLGIVDTLGVRNLICIPSDEKAQRVIDVTWGYLSSYPDSRILPAPLVVMTALLPVYPCPLP